MRLRENPSGVHPWTFWRTIHLAASSSVDSTASRSVAVARLTSSRAYVSAVKGSGASLLTSDATLDERFSLSESDAPRAGGVASNFFRGS